MTHPGVGRDHHPRTGDLAPPGKVEVLAHGDDPGVEAVQLSKQVGSDQGAAAGGDEDVSDRVVLAVVHLALEDAVDHGTRLVAAHADMEQDPRVVPVDELGRDDSGVGTEGLLDEPTHRIVVERHVVVAQQEEGSPLHHFEDLVRRRAVAHSAGQVAHEGIRQDPAHPLSHLVGLSAVRQHEDGKFLVVLGGERRERLFEPRAGLGGDHDGNHSRHLGVHQGAEAIRSAPDPSGTKFHFSTACYCLTNVILL